MAVNESAEAVGEKRRKLQLALRYTGVSLLLMVMSYMGVYAAGIKDSLLYVVVPFVFAYWLSVVWLVGLSYSWFMGTVAFLSILLPPLVFVIMLLAYSRAVKYLKETQDLPGAVLSGQATSEEPELRA